MFKPSVVPAVDCVPDPPDQMGLWSTPFIPLAVSTSSPASSSVHAPAPTPSIGRVHRVEVRIKPGRIDPRAASLARQAATLGIHLSSTESARIYLIQGNLSDSALQRIATRLLADPVTEESTLGARPARPGASTIEVHPLPGVMDPAAQSVRDAISDLIGADSASSLSVSTGLRFDVVGVVGASGDSAKLLAQRTIANEVIHQIHLSPWTPDRLPSGSPYSLQLRHIPIRGLNAEQLAKLSRDAHLFMSPEEMAAIQTEYQRQGRDPSDIELETLAQTWSEHCVHKTLKANIKFTLPEGDTTINWHNRPGHTVTTDASGRTVVTIDNLLKHTVAAATHELIAGGIDWALSVFKDNSGVIALDDTQAVCIKVETHNHPSAIEPYGGSATGAGGCIRDVIGTGLGAKPIANTDVFCVAYPTMDPAAQPPGTIHPKRILSEVVAGVRDYGNRMGIPTLNGAVFFDDRYVGNPLVFCGCIGLIPRDKIKGQAKKGDLIIALGGRTGRDGIHGATFSSTELEHTSADEFSHAVQIGNAIEEKRVMDAILRARDAKGGCLYTAMTDCGAGGFSSAVGEMGSKLGATVHLDRAPLKYAGLSYTEIWISEAQERMVLAVPAANLAALQQICDEERVELANLGTFGTDNQELILNYRGTEVGRMSMHFLHDGIPMPRREATWTPAAPAALAKSKQTVPAIGTALHALLSHPNIASKHWIIRQYDHEVQGNTIQKPLVGPASRGPGDAAVLEPVPGSNRGIAVGCGLALGVGDPARGGDPYQMALAGIDEAVRNLVCTGVDPTRIAILDNFCWPSCGKPTNLGLLVRACAGCYDGAKAYRTPFVSGKDSLNNQLSYIDASGTQRVIEIPPTLLITGLGIVPKLEYTTTSDAKQSGNVLLLIGQNANTHDTRMGGSIYAEKFGLCIGAAAVPTVDCVRGPRAAALMHEAIKSNMVKSAHDCSEGGVLVTIAEMLIGSTDGSSSLGFEIEHTATADAASDGASIWGFAESASRYIIEVAAADVSRVTAHFASIGVTRLGTLNSSGTLTWKSAALSESVDALTTSWRGTLDW